MVGLALGIGLGRVVRMNKSEMLELSLSRTFAPSESSMYGESFVPGNENVLELSLLGAKMTNFRSREQKRHATFVPESENVVELSLSVRNTLALLKKRRRIIR